MFDRKPKVLVIAGPNGSGKSTITQYLDIVGTYTNADDIVSATGISNERAAIQVGKLRYHSIYIKEDFAFETVLASRHKLNILEKAKAEGYFIECIFVLTVDPSVNVARVSARVAFGGHDVEERLIRERYYQSLDNIKKLLEICDIVHVYDNTEEPVRIIKKHKEDISIFPNDLWTEERILSLL